jgi:glycosyltransferase involved in cell wall biosynthesis
MAKTKRIGLLFSYDEAWVAGAYYIMNLVHALKTLPLIEQPKLIFYIKNENDNLIVKQLNYLNYEVVVLNSPLPFWKRVVNVLYRKSFNENRFLNFPNKFDLDIVFPFKFDNSLLGQKHWLGRLFWIPDLQEAFFPQFFSEQEIVFRKALQAFILNNKYSVVFSSKNALGHFHELYGKQNCNEFVLNFAVTHQSIDHLDKEKVLNKFGIDRPFFFSPNQFWVHKNHMIILQALVELKKHHENILVVFSGKESDYRNPDYFNSIKLFVSENNLDKHVMFLGFIDRAEQLLLIRESIAVIQPSLFEGWSTVIEDAKAFDKFIIASDIEVHQEQLNQNYLLFNPKSKDDLIKKVLMFTSQHIAIIPNNYAKAVNKFGQDFMQIINAITKN